MIKTLEAVFDGEVLRPIEPVQLEPNTRVHITIEVDEAAGVKPKSFLQTGSFLQTARELELEGPADWSEKLEDYLYGKQPPSDT
jgi:predicted DNA-binding antitoxin AbrB/MazE fold protein